MNKTDLKDMFGLSPSTSTTGNSCRRPVTVPLSLYLLLDCKNIRGVSLATSTSMLWMNLVENRANFALSTVAVVPGLDLVTGQICWC